MDVLLRWVLLLAMSVGCSKPSPRAPEPDARGGCRRSAIDQVVAPLEARLQHALDTGAYPLPGGDRGLRAQIADLEHKRTACAGGGGDDCAYLAVEGESHELFWCAVHVWQAECAAASARSCLILSDVYSSDYYMPSIRPFAADPRRSSELYARGAALYQQACDNGEATCRDMAFQPMVMRKEPKRALGILLSLCDRGDGQACSDAGSSLMADAKDRAALWERGCFAAHPSGSACMTLAQGDPARKAELEKRACELDARTCPRPHVEPPP